MAQLDGVSSFGYECTQEHIFLVLARKVLPVTVIAGTDDILEEVDSRYQIGAAAWLAECT